MADIYQNPAYPGGDRALQVKISLCMEKIVEISCTYSGHLIKIEQFIFIILTEDAFRHCGDLVSSDLRSLQFLKPGM